MQAEPAATAAEADQTANRDVRNGRTSGVLTGVRESREALRIRG